jgi:hypothetical protein
MGDNFDEWLKLADAPAVFDKSRRTMERHIDAGKLESKKEGGEVYVLVASLEDNYTRKEANPLQALEQTKDSLEEENLKQSVEISDLNYKLAGLQKDLEEAERAAEQALKNALDKQAKDHQDIVDGLLREKGLVEDAKKVVEGDLNDAKKRAVRWQAMYDEQATELKKLQQVEKSALVVQSALDDGKAIRVLRRKRVKAALSNLDRDLGLTAKELPTAGQASEEPETTSGGEADKAE